MKNCKKCKLKLRGKQKYCPLCQSELENIDEDEEVFPKIPTIFHQYNFFFRILILISVTISVISVVINIIIPSDLWWSFFVAAAIACFWVSMSVVIPKRRNIPKKILYQVFVLSILSVVWDYWIGWRGWSIDYVIPITCTLAMASMAIIAKVANLKANDYIIYLLIDVAFGIIPIIFVFLNIVNVRFPSLFCTASSIIFLTALILFEGESISGELRKRFHL